MRVLVVVMGLAALAAGLLNYFAASEPGYVYLSWFGYSAEMTVWLFMLSVVALAVGLIVAIRCVLGLVLLPFGIRRWFSDVDEAKLQSKTAHALAAFEEGHWLRARKALVRVAKVSKNPLVFYLLAARASHALKDKARVEEYLKQAMAVAPSGSMAVHLTQAQMQLDDDALEPCLATLVRAQAIDEDHPKVTAMLADVYLGLKDWAALYRLLPALKSQAASAGAYQRYLLAAGRGLLALAASDSEAALKQRWRDFSDVIKHQALLVDEYAGLLVQQGDTAAAQSALKQALRDGVHHPRLWLCLADYSRDDALAAMKLLPKLRGKLAEDAAYCLALSRLASVAGLAGQQESYLARAETLIRQEEQSWLQREILRDRLKTKLSVADHALLEAL